MGVIVPRMLGGRRAMLSQSRDLFAAMTTPPTDARKVIINSLMSAMVSSGMFALMDEGYLLAAADSQAARLNWFSPGNLTLSPVNSPVFTADQGYTGDGASTALDTLKAANAGTNFLQTSAGMTWIVPGANVQAAGAEIGSPTVSNCSGVARSMSDIATCRIGSSNGIAPASTNSNGIFTVTRTGTTLQVYRNGVTLGANGTITNAALTSATLTLLRSSVFTARLVSGGFWHGLPTPAQIATFHDALKVYCNALNPGALA